MNTATYQAAAPTKSEMNPSQLTESTSATPSTHRALVGTRQALPAHRTRRTAATGTLRSVVAEGRSYYGTGKARIRLLVLAAALTYGGGAAMFWLHAIVRGEQGPAIANAWHWILDSSLGFVGLTPVVAVLLPLTARLLKGRTASFAALGALFAVMTAPGPIFHNLIAGRGTPLARAATSFFGTDPGVAAEHAHAAHTHVAEPSAISSVIAQVGFGLPVYIGLAVLAGTVLHRLESRRATAGATRIADRGAVLATA